MSKNQLKQENNKSDLPELVKFDKLILKLLDIQKDKDVIDTKYSKARTLLFEAMKALGLTDYKLTNENEDGTEEVIAILSIVKRNKISFDLGKLKLALPKDQYRKVVDRSYTINNYDLMVKVMKKYKVPPKAIKSLIEVSETVNVARLQKCYDNGTIDINDIKDCYNIDYSEHLYVRNRNKVNEKENE